MARLTTRTLVFISSFSLFFSTALAHGTIGWLTIAGKHYDGVQPTQDGVPWDTTVHSPVRQVYTGMPLVKFWESQDLVCGQNAHMTSTVAPANPGDEIAVAWYGITFPDQWPHDAGPIMVYMAACPSSGCATWDAKDGKWFKIWQASNKPGTDDWLAASTLYHNQAPYKFNLPEDIAPGEYLIRNEVINAALGPPNYEFFPACMQVKIGGSGTGKPKASDIVSFPGAYKSTDKSFNLDVYNLGGKISAAYPMPGPPVASLASGGGSSGSGSGSGSSSSDSPAPSPASSSAASAAPSSTKASGSAPSSSVSVASPSSTGRCGAKNRKRNNSLNQTDLSASTGKHKLKRRHSRASRAVRHSH